MDDISYIVGLMRENTDAVGFIPQTTVESRYVREERYIIQADERGKRTGYVLHGKPTAGGVLTIAQAVIDHDFRERGHGRLAVESVIERARFAKVREIVLRCADDLEANVFWRALGFTKINATQPNNRRRRAINVYALGLWPRLMEDRE